MVLKLIVIIFLFLNLSACEVDDLIMYSIAKNERHPKKPIGYPYLISFNNAKDKEKLGKNIQEFFIDNRTIDCLNSKFCIEILDTLIANGIKNLDCGAYQINYLFWKMPIENYFDIKKSYDKACLIVSSHNQKFWSWENIAKYHSQTPKYNFSYKQKLLENITAHIPKGS